MNHIEKYKNLITYLNSKLESWKLDIDKEEKLLKNIIDIYKSKDEENIKNIIKEIDYENFDLENEKVIKTRDWNITEEDDLDIEDFSSIKSISAIFLDNLKNKVWK